MECSLSGRTETMTSAQAAITRTTSTKFTGKKIVSAVETVMVASVV